MANDTGSGKRPITRSARETLPKNVAASTSSVHNRRSERLEKRSPPDVRTNSEKKRRATTTSPLRRSESTTRNDSGSPCSSSKSRSSRSVKSPSKKESASKVSSTSSSEGETRDVEATSELKAKKMDARVYRAVFKSRNEDGKSNRMARSAREDDKGGGGKVDKHFKGNLLDFAKDDMGILPPGDDKGKELDDGPKMSRPVNESLGNNVTVGSLVPSNAVTCKTSGVPEDDKEKGMKDGRKLTRPVNGLSENNVNAGSSVPSNDVFHETSRAPGRVQSDSCREETSQMLGSRGSALNENLIKKCGEHDEGEKLISSKRKRTIEDMHSEASPSLVDDDDCNLIEDTPQSRIGGNIAGTSGLRSKRIRRILSDAQKNWGNLANNDDQHSSKSNGENLSHGSNEERPQENNVETGKTREQQRSLHLLLKPEMAKLCDILCLPDNVKSMVESCLEYTMSNYQICTEPASILQAFQLSLCCTAASLLKHKLDFEASLVLAKRHLGFDCEKEVVDTINSRLWDLRENFLLLPGNSNVTGSPGASEPSNRVYSYTDRTTEVELAQIDIFKNSKITQKRKNQWKKLLLMQHEEKQNLEKDYANEKDEFMIRFKIEWAAILQTYSLNDVMRKEKLDIYRREYGKRFKELERQHKICLKDLEAKQLESRCKFREFSTPDELLNLVDSKELGTGVESLQTHDQAQHHNAPIILLSDRIGEGKNFDDAVEAMTRTETGVRLSEAPDINSSVVVPCSSRVELQIPLVKHASANETVVTAEDEPKSGNKCNNITGNEYDNQGNTISKLSNSREQCSGGAISIVDKGEGCVNFGGDSHNDCGQDAITSVLLSSNQKICDGQTSDVPSREVTLAPCKTSSSNDDHVEVPSRQGELGGTILSKPVCGLSMEDGSDDGMKNTASLNSQSSEEHIPSVSTVCTSNCENAAQIHEGDGHSGSNNAETLTSPLFEKRISPQNSNSPQEHPHNVNVMGMPNCESSVHIHEDDGNGSNKAGILNSPQIDERNAEGTMVLNRDLHLGMLETVNFSPSLVQISGGAVDVSVLDGGLSRPCGSASPSNSSDANTLILNEPSLEEQNPDGVSSHVPAGQIPAEVSEISHERATASVLDGEEAAGIPGTVNCTDCAENVTPLNSSRDQISDGTSGLDGVLLSDPCTTNPSNGCPATITLLNPPSLQQQTPDRVFSTLPDEQIPVSVPDNSHEEARCLLTENLVVDTSISSDQQEGTCRTVTLNSLSQENAVSRSLDPVEPLEEEQPSSSVQSPSTVQDTGREMQNPPVSSPVDIVPANQPIHVSPAMEPPEQEVQLPSAGFLSSNQDVSNLPLVTGTVDRPTNENDLPSHIPETAIEIQNQAIMQSASNLALDSSCQVGHPASNMDLDSLVSGGVRPQSSDTRNLSTPAEINNQPIQTAIQSASRIGRHPLQNELEKLRMLTDQNMKNHENKKLQLKCEFDKEFEELRRKFETKLKEIEVEYQQKKKNLDTQLNIVLVNKILAEAFRAKSMDHRVSGTPGMQQDASFSQHLFLLTNQLNATRPPPVAASSSCGPPTASLQNSFATTGPLTMVPPIQATYNTSGVFSSVSPRTPHVNSTSASPLGNLQASGEIRAPAPHLQYRPPAFVAASSPQGRPTQPAPGNIPVTSHPSFSNWLSQPLAATFQCDPHRGHRPVATSAGGIPTPNLSAMDLRANANNQPDINRQNILPHLSCLAVASLTSKLGSSNSNMPANSAHQATSPDVVCLSDDD
ncbi:hypothetical protein RJT34_29853 [Clitoria ternatea]|uniref:MOM1 alpha-helical domain-containing protein n=1 Tax=Clitoria ternatea TaxID=43366 RepID=A0AAN9ERP8_CLITE